MMNPQISRRLAKLKNWMNLAPGPELNSLIQAAETCQTEDELPAWIRTGLAKMDRATSTAA